MLGRIFAFWYARGLQFGTDFAKQAHQNNVLIGVIIAKLERHRMNVRGYIAMLAVQGEHRGRGIGFSRSAIS